MIRNPILPGFNPDPSILRVGEDYYIATSTFEWFPGIAIYHSRDLKHWTLRTHALRDEAQLDLRRLPSAKGVWAPCLTYDEGAGLFYLAYSLMLSHNARYFDVDNFLITSSSIDGPWSAPVYLHSVGFDPSLFHDEDGRKYLACLEWELRGGPGRPGGIVVQEYDAVLKSMVGPLKKVWDGGTKRGCVEGPHLYKRDGWYYLMAAEGGTGYGHCVTMARSRSVWGPYEGDPENPILTATDDFDEADRDDFLKPHRFNPASPLQKVGHASWVETPAGEHYIAHICSRPFVPELRCTLGRETALQKMFWTEDGWLRLAGGGNRAALEVPAPRKGQTPFPACPLPGPGAKDSGHGLPGGRGVAEGREHFDGEWNIHLVTPRYSRTRFASTDERPGFLRLHGRQSLCSLDEVALVARRLTSLHAEVACSVEFDPIDFRQSAGLVAYYDNMNYRYLRITREQEGGDTLLMLTSLVNGTREERPCAILPKDRSAGSRLYLRLTVRDRELRFFYTLDASAERDLSSAEWIPAGPVLDTSELSDEFCKYGEFTGTFVGVACVDARSRSAFADFDWLEYQTPAHSAMPLSTGPSPRPFSVSE